MLFFIRMDNFQCSRPLQFELKVLFQQDSMQLSSLWSTGKQDVLLTVLQIVSLTICLLDSNFGFHSSSWGECADFACCPPCIFSRVKLLLLLSHPFFTSQPLLPFFPPPVLRQQLPILFSCWLFICASFSLPLVIYVPHARLPCLLHSAWIG